ncbi:hypothetical protein D3C83_37840 [compost metagenome]
MELCRVIAEHEGYGGNRAGLDHAHARPRKKETHPAAEGAAEKEILAAGIGKRAAKLGVTQCADQRNQPAGNP